MTYLKDTIYLVVLVLLLPLLMVAAWTALIVIVIRQLYWWARGNSTPLTRHGGRPQASLGERWISWSGRWHLRPAKTPETVIDLARSSYDVHLAAEAVRPQP
jgi:hypothetical protein